MACNINISTLALYVDGTLVPLVYAGVTGAGYPSFNTGAYAIEVDGNTGRTVNLQVIGNGISLIPANPAQVNCVGYTARYAEQVDFPAIVCYHANPATIIIKPGPAVERFSGIVFYGSQSAGQEICPFTIIIRVRRTAPEEVCPVKCITESVDIPAGFIKMLVNDAGHQYAMNGYVGCNRKDSVLNLETCEVIRQMILANMGRCTDPGVKVFFEYVPTVVKCVRIVIVNSPIKFNYLKAGDTYYNFTRTGC